MNKDEMKMIEQIRKDFVARCLKGSDGCDLRDCQHCHAESLYNAGYRKVADDEIVIKKSEYDTLLKAYTQIYDNAYKWGLKVGEEKTAREILQALKDNIVNRIGTKYAVIDLTGIAQLAKENGIELED